MTLCHKHETPVKMVKEDETVHAECKKCNGYCPSIFEGKVADLRKAKREGNDLAPHLKE